MRKCGKRALMLSLLTGLFLSGCTSVESPSNLIEPPQPQNKQKVELRDKLTQLLPANSELITPENATTKQSIFMKDIDADGKQEAFLLYRGLGENRKVHILVLQETNHSWDEIKDFETDYYKLDYFNLHDLDDDGEMEAVIGLGMSDFEAEKQLGIYQWDDKEGLKKVIEHSYEIVDISDYNEDDKPDVLLVYGKRRESYQAELFQYTQHQLESLSVLDLEPFSFHEHSVGGNLQDGKRALFIDSAVGAHSMITEIIAFEQQKLIKVEDKIDGMVIKEYPLYSKDINGDGVIEVGGMYIPKGWEDEAFADIPFIETYTSYSIEGEANKLTERFTNREHRFFIEIPLKWHGNVTAKKLDAGVQLRAVSNQELLFEVRWASKDSVDADNKILKEIKDKVFYTTMKENKAFPFKQFQLLENEF